MAVCDVIQALLPLRGLALGAGLREEGGSQREGAPRGHREKGLPGRWERGLVHLEDSWPGSREEGQVSFLGDRGRT